MNNLWAYDNPRLGDAGIDPHTRAAPTDDHWYLSFADIVDVIVMIMGKVVGDDVFILRRGAWQP